MIWVVVIPCAIVCGATICARLVARRPQLRAVAPPRAATIIDLSTARREASFRR
jgi:hypothetical protein